MMRPLRLPWTPSSVPHILLDINRECNISCASCYNKKHFEKSLDQVQQDYLYAKSQRRLHSVTIVGGEPTLHPDLCAIITMIKADGKNVILLSNGLKLTPPYLQELRAAGLDIILLHIDEGQERPDLPEAATADDIAALRTELSRRIVEQGMEAGFVITIYDIAGRKLIDLVDYINRSPYAHFLLATLNWEPRRFDRVIGSVTSGLSVEEPAGIDPVHAPGTLTLNEVRTELLKYDMAAFATLGSSASVQEVRWLCYTEASLLQGAQHVARHNIRSGFSDRVLLRLFRLVTGRYMYYVKRSELRFHLQLLLNSVSGGRFSGNFKALLRSLFSSGTLYEKRFVFQQGPSINQDGTIEHCRSCPDATVVDGTIVPVCLSDGWICREP